VARIEAVTVNPSITGETDLIDLETLSIAVFSTTRTNNEEVRNSYKMANRTVPASISSLPGR